MLVKFIVEIVTEVDVIPDDVCNSDTIGDYKAELDCSISNDVLHYLSGKFPKSDIVVHSSEPWGEGVEEYGRILNNWRPEYERRMAKYKQNEG